MNRETMDGENISASVAVNRILDANLDRAREGVRVIEEWCRFGLDNAELAAECKDLRQAIAQWHSADIRAARDTPGDVGTALSHVGETQRTSISDLLQVNLSRIQEALRVLEEYGKLGHPDLAAACKQLRYRVYGLESKLLASAAHPRQVGLRRSPLYLVTAPSETLLTTVEAALQGGLTLVQYRDKHTPDKARLPLAQALRRLCQRYNALFIVNDRIDLALAIQADGVHLGQEDAPIAVARHLLGPQVLIGRSTHCPDELQRAIAEGADYVGIGPVYATPTKAGRAAVGLDYVRYAAEHCSIPWYAIGGIDPTNLADVTAAGATRVAVVRALMEATDPANTTRQFLSHLSSRAEAL